MTNVITHKKTSSVPDGPNNSLVQPSDWNDDHNINIPFFVALFVAITPLAGTTANIAANPGINIYTVYNTSGGVFNANLPENPANNQIVQIIDAGLTSGSHNISVNGAGNNICCYGQSSTNPAIIASDGGSISLVWDGNQWTQNA